MTELKLSEDFASALIRLSQAMLGVSDLWFRHSQSLYTHGMRNEIEANKHKGNGISL
jgi:hypothetical protein